jgi:serine phosphatase RsbU (regulator of sigma subunit)
VAIAQRAGQAPSRLVDSLLAEIERFASGHVFPDDVCLVSMEIARLTSNAPVASAAVVVA